MRTEIENVLLSIGKDVIAEYSSKTNTLTYRELLDKHAARIAILLPPKPEPWLWLNVYTQRVAAKK